MARAYYGKNTELAVPCCPNCGHSLAEPPKHGIIFHTDTGIVHRDGQEAKLTPMQLTMLECFMDKYPRNVSEIAIQFAIYGQSQGSESNIVNSQLCKMRRKLEPLGVYFVNEYGFGWSMKLIDAMSRHLRKAR